ncbi:hypothetical protein Tco_1289412 [Tanacetum coccineum]
MKDQSQKYDRPSTYDPPITPPEYEDALATLTPRTTAPPLCVLVLKEVKLKIFQLEPWKKPPLLGELDRDIMRAFEREIANLSVESGEQYEKMRKSL